MTPGPHAEHTTGDRRPACGFSSHEARAPNCSASAATIRGFAHGAGRSVLRGPSSPFKLSASAIPNANERTRAKRFCRWFPKPARPAVLSNNLDGHQLSGPPAGRGSPAATVSAGTFVPPTTNDVKVLSHARERLDPVELSPALVCNAAASGVESPSSEGAPPTSNSPRSRYGSHLWPYPSPFAGASILSFMAGTTPNVGAPTSYGVGYCFEARPGIPCSTSHFGSA